MRNCDKDFVYEMTYDMIWHETIKWYVRRDSAVNIAPGYELDGRGVEFESWYGQDILLSTSPRPLLRPTQPPIQRVAEALFQGGKVVGAWSWPFISSKCWDQEYMGPLQPFPHTFSWRCASLVKHRDNIYDKAVIILITFWRIASIGEARAHWQPPISVLKFTLVSNG
jgi:hypothetical protein